MASMGMQPKDFEEIANVLQGMKALATYGAQKEMWLMTVKAFARHYGNTQHRFDTGRFMETAGAMEPLEWDEERARQRGDLGGGIASDPAPMTAPSRLRIRTPTRPHLGFFNPPGNMIAADMVAAPPDHPPRTTGQLSPTYAPVAGPVEAMPPPNYGGAATGRISSSQAVRNAMEQMAHYSRRDAMLHVNPPVAAEPVTNEDAWNETRRLVTQGHRVYIDEAGHLSDHAIDALLQGMPEGVIIPEEDMPETEE